MLQKNRLMEQNGNMLPLPTYIMLKNIENRAFTTLHHHFTKAKYKADIQIIEAI